MAEYSTQIAARVALALRAPVRSRALRGLHRFGKISFFEDNTDNADNVFHLDNLFSLVYINKLSVLFILSSKPKKSVHSVYSV